jgi:hypothetical protein
MLATGEEVLRGHSLRARLLIVELRQCEVDQAVLNRCQRAWQDGRLASAMGGYLAWIACRYEELQGLLAKRVQRLRGRAYGTVSAVHARLPGDDGKIEGRLGNLATISVPSIVPSRHNWKRTAEKALDEVAAAQPSYHQARSALRF